MSKTVNILGSTHKEQWLSAVQIFETCIISNLDAAITDITEFEYAHECNIASKENIDVARRETHNFANEMRRLIQAACDDN